MLEEYVYNHNHKRKSESELSTSDTRRDSSTQSSMTSESCSSSSFTARLSFDLLLPSSSSSSSTLKPHRSSDLAYSAIRSRKAGLTFNDFRLLRHIGSGDIGTVYLCHLADDVVDEERCCYAMKVVDREALAMKKKVQRAEMEKKILKMLDHPFLPTLYAEFEASHYSCVLMEYCSGGDLHSLRHKQPQRRFPLNSARFYAAEVLVALEYLHMLGIIYRDLKPENVLVRSDGHIMLSDFDLSLCSDSIPTVESPPSSPEYPTSPLSRNRPQPKTRLSRLFRRVLRSKKMERQLGGEGSKLFFVAEPVAARSRSFVGTHEYVSPEVASGGSHGNAVDWWAFGIFVYEMIYGRTPFAAPSNELTLRNIVKKPLTFPTHSPSSLLEHHARDLISGLLNKDPNSRLGSKRGAAELKTHPFFKPLNFALIRSVTPPEIPGLRRQSTAAAYCHQKSEEPKQSAAFDYF